MNERMRRWGWASPWARIRHLMTAGVWVLAGVLVAHGTVRAVELWTVPDDVIQPWRWWPWLWPPLFFAAAASLAAFLRRPTPRLYRVCGLAVWVAMAGQVVALALSGQPWSWALTTRVMLWGTAAVGWVWVWLLAGLLVHPEVWVNGHAPER